MEIPQTGSTNPDHIQENIEIFDFELTDEEMEQIRAMDQGESGRRVLICDTAITSGMNW